MPHNFLHASYRYPTVHTGPLSFLIRFVRQTTTPVVVFVLLVMVLLQPLAPVLAEEVVAPASTQETAPADTAPTPTESAPAVAEEAAPATTDSSEATADAEKSEAEAVTEEESAAQTTSPQQQKIERTNYAPTLPKVDGATGALTFSIPIQVPAGRGGATPQLALNYNSQDTRTFTSIGRGWSLSIPEIKRVNVTGTQALFSDDVFESSLSGKLVLVATNADGSKTYAPRIETPGAKMKYTWIVAQDGTSRWQMVDQQGTVYTFGITAAARQDDPGSTQAPVKPANPARIYRWMVDEITDANGNSVRYAYQKQDGQIVPARITYPHHPSVSTAPFEVTTVLSEGSVWAPQFDTAFRVDQKFRIDALEVKSHGQVVRRYDITRKLDVATHLVTAVTESYRNATGGLTALPPTRFTYPDSSVANGWEPRSDWETFNFIDFQNNNAAFALRSVELNGDGLPDFVFGWKSAINTGVKYWTQDAGRSVPIRSHRSDINDEPIDVNGDGLTDKFFVGGNPTPVTSHVYPSTFHINNGATLIEDPNHAPLPPQVYMNHYFSGSVVDNGGVRTLDANGDGVTDILQGLKFSTCCSQSQTRYIHRLHVGTTAGPTGYNWKEIPWSGIPTLEADPLTSTLDTSDSTSLNFVDTNADGLVDNLRYATYFGEFANSVFKADLNTGDGWDRAETVPTFFDRDVYGDRILTADINGDGMEDLMGVKQACQGGPVCTTVKKVFLGTGRGYVEATAMWPLPDKFVFIAGASGNALRPSMLLSDVNGDGAVDLMVNTITSGTAIAGAPAIYLNRSANALVPNSITLPTGAKLEVTYKNTPELRSFGNVLANPQLPLSVKVVESIKSDETGTETYMYEGGLWVNRQSGISDSRYNRERQVVFAKVTTTRPDGSKRIERYHQGNTNETAEGEHDDHVAKLGRVYRADIVGADGQLLQRTYTRWRYSSLTNAAQYGHWFVAPSSVTVVTNGTVPKVSSETFGYTTSGNRLYHIRYGEGVVAADGTFTDTGNDKVTVNYSYATWVSGTPAAGMESSYVTNEVITGADGLTLNRSTFYYDGLPLRQVSRGNSTQEDRWISGTSSASIRRTYTPTGLLAAETDAGGNVTTTTYDALQLYPASIKNALNHTTTFTYDIVCGLPTFVTDPNGSKVKTILDGRCRVTREEVSDPRNTESLVLRWLATYFDTTSSISVTERQYMGSRSILTTRYYDKLGRLVQSRRAGSGVYVVTDTAYDTSGRIRHQSLPYEGRDSWRSVLPPAPALFTTYTYDGLDRPLTETTAVGVTTSSYNGWTTTVVDPNGHRKEYVRDAYGRLAQVRETNQGQVYTTSYTYDSLGRLTGLTDAEGNVRNFTYNGLGLRTRATDLHAPADTIFGTWTYAYDSRGNLITRTDPRGTVINYAYDALSRLRSEDAPSLAGVEETYTYDTCTNGVGRLCSTITAAVTTNYEYDSHGNVATEQRTISGRSFTTRYRYDLLKNIVQVIMPDGAEQISSYSFAGLVEHVRSREPGGSFVTVASYVYGPHDQPTTITYGNGVVTTNTYDAAMRYRLVRKQTVAPAAATSSITYGPIVQDLTYTYDAVGNIKQVVDASDTNTKKTVVYTYDDLDRLLTATATGARNAVHNYTEAYTYSPVGNILTKTVNGVVSAYRYEGHLGTSYANPHAATSVVTGTSSKILTYDNSGNLVRDGGAVYRWDYDNRLITSWAPRLSTYRYGIGTERVVADGTQYPNRWYNATCLDGACQNPKITKHLFAGDSMVATIEGTGAAALSYAQHTDHLSGQGVTTAASLPAGSVTIAGAAVEITDYTPYGAPRVNERAQGGSFQEQRKYIGEEYDPASGLSYLNARYYDPKRGQFLSQDPAHLLIGDASFKSRFDRELSQHLLDPQQLNSYSYARSNPIRLKDESGEIVPFLVAGAIIAWQAFEVGATVYDGYNAYQTFRDPNASGSDKAIAASGFVAGLVGPGGGYGASLKKVAANIDNAAEILRYQRAIGAPHIWDPNPRIQNSVVNAYKYHWLKHKSEFPGLHNAKQYAEEAWRFVSSPPSGTQFKKLSNGRDVQWDPVSNVMVFRQNGVPSSMYKPNKEVHRYSSNQEYFDSLK